MTLQELVGLPWPREGEAGGLVAACAEYLAAESSVKSLDETLESLKVHDFRVQ